MARESTAKEEYWLITIDHGQSGRCVTWRIKQHPATFLASETLSGPHHLISALQMNQTQYDALNEMGYD